MPMPKMEDVLAGWKQRLRLRVVRKDVTDFEINEADFTYVDFVGVLLPMPQQALAIKPEGQRSWKWWTLGTRTHLDNGNIVLDKEGREYRVMNVEDWNQAGYRRYQVAEGVPREQRSA